LRAGVRSEDGVGPSLTIFSTFSLIIACIVRTRERFMGVGQLMTMPLFFASNAIYPVAIMPRWLQVIAHVNPLSYQVDALRALMLKGGTSEFGLPLDLGVMAFALIIVLGIGTWLYPRIVQ
jgi:ABC-2 type transport system permease protein